MTPDDVLARALEDLPEGAYLTAAIVIVEYQVPGEDTADERGPFLSFRRDDTTGAWAHLGMLETVAGDVRYEVRPDGP